MRPVVMGKRLIAVMLVAAVAFSAPGCLTTKSVANKATFGLIGDKQKIAEQKSEKNQLEQDRKKQEQDRKQQARDEKKARRQARDEAKAKQRADEKAAKDAKKLAKRQGNTVPGEKVAEAEPDSTKRSFLNKATFGLIGSEGDKPEKPETQAPQTSPKEEKRAARQAKKQAERDRDAAKKQAKVDKRAERKQADADRKQAKADAKAAKKAEESQEKPAEETASAPDQPKQKRTLLSRATFGLVGGGAKAEKKEEKSESAAPTESAPEAKDAKPEKTAKADQPVITVPEEPKTPIQGEHRGIARIPFKTEVTTVGQTASGLPKVEVSRRTYSDNGYGITDLGDVRIAVKGMTFPAETRASGVVVQSDERGVAAGKSGKGNESFAFEYTKGVTTCTFGKIQFTIGKAVISIDGHDVPLGKGRRLVVVNESGKVDAVYNIGG